LSWSRVAMCRQWLNSQNANGVFLSVASIFHAPYADSSFDVVYTSHTMEPNGGQELAILQELYRITSRFLVLLEPGYEFASAEAQMRMERLGYVRELREKAEQLGMRVVENRLFDVTGNPLNPTAITIIEKNPSASPATPILACPRYGDVLQDYGDSFYSQDSMRAYPKIQGIPCLRVDDGIVASHYMERLTSKNSAFERRVA
ncbi:MAG: class I SAM-dependent methyltransferase, partial [Planctomycetaceae bacterium]|nr:class I SAM-dependent methyltransferase [Planctomycetaceae bacterium]